MAGNSLLVSEVVRRVRPVELRYYLVAPHYRSHVEYSEHALVEAGASYRRIEGFVERATEVVGAVPPGELPTAFVEAMDDDLGVPQALAVVHETVRAGNTALAEGREQDVASAVAAVRAMTAVLGLDPLDPHWTGAEHGGPALRPVVDALVELAIQQRQEARARKDFAAADAVRDALKTAGVQLEDTPTGTRWTLEERGEPVGADDATAD